MCVCVCVYVRERESEWSQKLLLILIKYKIMLTVPLYYQWLDYFWHNCYTYRGTLIAFTTFQRAVFVRFCATMFNLSKRKYCTLRYYYLMDLLCNWVVLMAKWSVMERTKTSSGWEEGVAESVNEWHYSNSRHVQMWYNNGYISGIPKILLNSGIEQLM